jgi:hypothetical protein
MALSEIVRFVLSSHRTSDFAKLREYLPIYGGIKDQYYGPMASPSASALPIKKHEMC